MLVNRYASAKHHEAAASFIHVSVLPETLKHPVVFPQTGEGGPAPPQTL